MTIITDLPAELIEAIAGEIKRWKDLADFRATCRHIDNILTPRILSTITLDLGTCGNARNLIRMADGPTRMHLYARTLKIRHLAPAMKPSHIPNITARVERWSDVVEATRIISQYLPGAIQHFHHLDAVEWKTHHYDAGDAIESVMDLLCSQDNLRKVSIDMGSRPSRTCADLGRLSNLSELSITFPESHGPLFLGIAQALKNCPHLTHLRIQVLDDFAGPEEIELDQISRELASLNNIRTLSLSIPTIRYLNKFSALSNMSELTSLELRPTNFHKGWNELWRALGENHIHLKSICFNLLNMDTSFIDYLSSYSGVEELWLSNTEEYWVDGEVNRTPLATSFFDVVVARHAATLRVLEIYLFFSDSVDWGDVPERPSRLAKLHALKRLKIELPNIEIEAIRASSSDNDRRLRNLLGLVSIG